MKIPCFLVCITVFESRCLSTQIHKGGWVRGFADVGIPSAALERGVGRGAEGEVDG